MNTIATIIERSCEVGSLDFVARARVERTSVYVRRIWKSHCGGYRVSEFSSQLERRRVFYAERCDSSPSGCPVWVVISGHRRQSTAFAACTRHRKATNRRPPPKG